MLILNKKSGFTLVEVMCSIAVFSIIFISAFTIKLCTKKVKNYNNILTKYTYYCSEIKNDLLVNASRDDIVKLIKSNKKYINLSTINENDFKNENVINLFTDFVNQEDAYAEINAIDDVLQHIFVKVSFSFLDKKIIYNFDFYKG